MATAMIIRRLEVERFRGIKSLTWDPVGKFVCLLGPGDSTKSTILDAIELALSPRWNIPFDDNDFYEADTKQPIKITVTVGDLPDDIISDAKHGLDTRVWGSDGQIHDEPSYEKCTDGDELVLAVQLRVEPTLEQSWIVVNDRNPDGRPISAKDREKIGCTRVGNYVERHLSWGKGTVLTKLTDEPDNVSGILAEAARAARGALDPLSLPRLGSAATKAQTAGEKLGVAARSGYVPHLDVQATAVGVGGLALHDGAIPVRVSGLGSRRLLAMAMQLEVAKANCLTLIDEVETALEPHRLRRLLRALRSDTAGPVLVTTHCRLVLEELPAGTLHIVRNAGGQTVVKAVAADLQPVVRSCAEAFLAKKVLFCEGRTELGLCRALDDWWSSTEESFGLLGVSLADGGGSDAPSRAMAMQRLGYATALLGDSDRPIQPTQGELESEGAAVFLWADGLALEERLAQDLPWEGVAAMVELAIEEWGDASVRGAVASRLEGVPADLQGEPATWNLALSEEPLRAAIAGAAKTGNQKRGWFKRVDLAERLGKIVVGQWAAIEGTDLRSKIEAVRTWTRADE
jgi:ABC-type branched-subunit amino acid transport system ATPase component